ncbi:steroid delta-isomerase [Rhodococcus sp. 27YEA15]|uniref:nuclear transport factor 2 family protein n=1 Tax=Rhodococcus sp. 27YEA15 TaxID=3156259 RepID=UPI003C7E49AD
MHFPAMPQKVAQFFEGSQTSDPRMWADSFSKDGLFYDPVGSDPIDGRENIYARLVGAFDAFKPFYGLTPESAFTTGGVTAVKWSGAVVHRESGSPVNWAGITVFELTDSGEIANARAYFNHDVFAAQLPSK